MNKAIRMRFLILTTMLLAAYPAHPHLTNPSLIAKLLFIPYTTFHNCTLGKQDADPRYCQKLEAFLKYYDLQNVPIKKIEAPQLVRTLITPIQKPIQVFLDGIWLDEQQLDQMKESELIFNAACAATMYARLDPKDVAASTALEIAVPLATLLTIQGIGNFLELAPPQLGFDTGSFVALLKNFATYTTVLFIGHTGLMHGHKLFKPFIHHKEIRNACTIITQTTKMLCKNGYGWFAEEYAQLLKERIAQNKVVIQQEGPLSTKQICALIEAYLAKEHRNSASDAQNLGKLSK